MSEETEDGVTIRDRVDDEKVAELLRRTRDSGEEGTV